MPRVLVEAHRRPVPPYALGPLAALAGATAMCDVSDGLLADLGHVAVASGVAMDLDAAAFTVTPQLRDAGAALGVEPLEWVLGGGEDHALAATYPQGSALPEGFVGVGRVLEGGSAEPGSVLVGGTAWAGPRGHAHFG